MTAGEWEEDDWIPSDFDRDQRLEHALRCWRSSEDIHRRQFGETERAYEQAINDGVRALQRFTTMDELLDHYYDDRDYHCWVGDRWPRAGTVEQWAEVARGLVTYGPPHLYDCIFVDAAFWRRLVQLVALRVNR